MVEVQAERLEGSHRAMDLVCGPCKARRRVRLDEPDWTDRLNAFLVEHKACAPR